MTLDELVAGATRAVEACPSVSDYTLSLAKTQHLVGSRVELFSYVPRYELSLVARSCYCDDQRLAALRSRALPAVLQGLPAPYNLITPEMRMEYLSRVGYRAVVTFTLSYVEDE